MFKFMCIGIIITASYGKNSMLPVEEGCFVQNRNETNEQVCLKPFFIQKTEVTQAEYLEVMGKNPSSFHTGWFWNKKMDCLDCPVENISWNDAEEYCKKIGAYLPSDKQWEYAARGGSKSKGYSFSGSNYSDSVAWFQQEGSGGGTEPVGSLKANELGLFDMSGNVREWVGPKEQKKGMYNQRVNSMGGCVGLYFSDNENDLTELNGLLENTESSYVGFRCAADSLLNIDSEKAEKIKLDEDDIQN